MRVINFIKILIVIFSTFSLSAQISVEYYLGLTTSINKYAVSDEFRDSSEVYNPLIRPSWGFLLSSYHGRFGYALGLNFKILGSSGIAKGRPSNPNGQKNLVYLTMCAPLELRFKLDNKWTVFLENSYLLTIHKNINHTLFKPIYIDGTLIGHELFTDSYRRHNWSVGGGLMYTLSDKFYLRGFYSSVVFSFVNDRDGIAGYRYSLNNQHFGIGVGYTIR
jgi:hypothetical protein